MKVEDLISIPDAAELLNMARSSVYYAIEQGKLQTVNVAGRKLLKRAEVVNYKPAGYKDRRPSVRKPRTKASAAD